MCGVRGRTGYAYTPIRFVVCMHFSSMPFGVVSASQERWKFLTDEVLVGGVGTGGSNNASRKNMEGTLSIQRDGADLWEVTERKFSFHGGTYCC